MWLNVLLSALALTSTLAAFGGETWQKGDEQFVSRITARGWLSLACLLFAFGLGIVKEKRASTAAKNSELRESSLSRQLTTKTDTIDALQARLEKTQISLSENVKNLSDDRFMQLEAKFQALSNVPEQYFNGVTYFSGTSKDVFDNEDRPLILYARDVVSLVLESTPRNAEVALAVGTVQYHLRSGTEWGVEETKFPVRGKHSEPMSVRILNPEKAKGSIKWSVTSNTTVRQDEVFKQLLARSQAPEHIKANYVVVGPSGEIIYQKPDPKSQVVERPEAGLLVKRILNANPWSQIQMPGGRLGWIRNGALVPLQ